MARSKTTSFTQNIAVGPSSAAGTLLTLLEVGDLRKIVAWPTLTILYCLHCKARGQCYRQYLGKKFFTTSSLERTSTRHLLKEKTFRHPGHLNRSSETRSTPAVYRGHRVLLHWHTSIEHITIEDAEAIGLAHGDIIYVLQFLNTGAAWSFLRDERRHGPPCEAVEQIHIPSSRGRVLLHVVAHCTRPHRGLLDATDMCYTHFRVAGVWVTSNTTWIALVPLRMGLCSTRSL